MEEIVARPYSKQENYILTNMWPDWPPKEILKALTGRTWDALAQQAHVLKLKRSPKARWPTRSAKPSTAHPLFRELRRLRLEKGWTRAELAKRTGYCRSNICRWEMGRSAPSWSSVLVWLEAMNVELKVAPIAERKSSHFASTATSSVRNAVV
ncbi:MAG: helix-turn-helix domain-containing protein [Nitrospira sp.]|nr:helix-turn-helix domain-containing protein [Nitrospira sp.]